MSNRARVSHLGIILLLGSALTACGSVGSQASRGSGNTGGSGTTGPSRNSGVSGSPSDPKTVRLGKTLALSFQDHTTLNIDVLQASRQIDGTVDAEVLVRAPSGLETGYSIYGLCGNVRDPMGHQITGDVNAQQSSAIQELALAPNQAQIGWINVSVYSTAIPPLRVVCQVGNEVGLWTIP